MKKILISFFYLFYKIIYCIFIWLFTVEKELTYTGGYDKLRAFASHSREGIPRKEFLGLYKRQENYFIISRDEYFGAFDGGTSKKALEAIKAKMKKYYYFF